MKIFFAFCFLFATAGCGSPKVQQVNAASLPDSSGAYLLGEYSVKQVAPAAVDADVMTLTIKAVGRGDKEALASLSRQGVAFDLPVGTKVVLTPVELYGAQLRTSLVGTVDGIGICQGTIESGRRVGTKIVVACDALAR